MKTKIVFILCLLLILSSVNISLGKSLADVSWHIEGDRLIINLRAQDRIAYTTFTLSDPVRFVIDVYNVTIPDPKSIEINKSPVKSIRMAPKDEGRLRIVLETVKMPEYNINLSKNEKELFAEFKLNVSYTSNSIRKVLYGNDAVSIFFNTTLSRYEWILDDNPPRFIMEFPLTSLTGKIERVSDSSVVNRILGYDYEDREKNINTVLIVELKEKIAPLIARDQDNNIIRLNFKREEVSSAQTKTVPSPTASTTPKEQTVKVSPGEKRVSLNFKDADIKDVLQALSMKAGVNIIVDEGVSKKITLTLNNVTAREALEMITKASGLAYERWNNGYIVASPVRLLEILDSGMAKVKQTVESIEIRGDIVQIQNTLKVVYPDIVTSVSGRYIVLRGEEGKIGEAKRLIGEIDKPQEVAVVKEIVESIEIKGETEKIIQSIKTVYPELVITGSNGKIIIKGEEGKVKEGIELAKRIEVNVVDEPKVREVIRLKGLEAQSVKDALSGISEVSITAIKQTNSLIVQGTKSKVEEIKSLIGVLDVEPSKESKYAVESIEIRGDIVQIQNTLKTVYPDIVTSVSGRYIVLRGEEGKIGEAKRLIGEIDKPQEVAELIAKTTEITERMNLKYIEAKDFVESVKGLFPPDTISVESPTNSILVKGTKDTIDRVRSFITAVDIPTPQYMLEAKLVEVNRDGALLLGVDTSLSGSVGVNLSADDFALESLTSLVSTTVQLNAILNMAQSKGLAKVIAAPKIAAIDGKEASIFIGDNIYYTIPTTEGGFELRQVSAGVTLSVTPKMERDKMIRLKIAPEVSSITGWTGSGATIAPNVGTRRATTELKVKDGDTVVIGGLMRASDTDNIKKVPLLSNIPILGQLFQSRDTKQEERELIIMITVNMVKEEE